MKLFRQSNMRIWYTVFRAVRCASLWYLGHQAGLGFSPKLLKKTHCQSVWSRWYTGFRSISWFIHIASRHVMSYLLKKHLLPANRVTTVRSWIFAKAPSWFLHIPNTRYHPWTSCEQALCLMIPCLLPSWICWLDPLQIPTRPICSRSNKSRLIAVVVWSQEVPYGCAWLECCEKRG